MNSIAHIALILLVACAAIFGIASGTDRAAIGLCIRNCAQCKTMFGPYFMGQKCADYCVKYKGKFIPDCEDEGSILPFLQAINGDY